MVSQGGEAGRCGGASQSRVVKQHGEMDAVIHSAQRADGLMDAGDMEGRRVWLKVLKAVKELSDAEPAR